ncbi:MAG: CPBP family intramembrane metalloprotease [Tenericutes bacterium]|nr:CPBP family intramembrane metalloprotease [Mycoplasmatota bacterium]
MKYTAERKLSVNIAFFICILVGMFFIPYVFNLILSNFITNSNISELLSNVLYIEILYLIYYKDLNSEFKIFKEKFKKNMTLGFKYYFVGVFLMIFSNIIISLTVGDISANETLVREQLFSNMVFSMISISIIAPITEELIFRKSLMPILKNKWVYAFFCGLLFGLAHLISGEMTWISLVYLLPYGSLGFVFALMNKETKTTFTSITIHAIHNTFTGTLLLILYFSGIV